MTRHATPPPPGSDAQIIARLVRDPDAFAPVFDRHFAAVHGFLARRVGTDLADEIAAATFARAFDRRRRYDLVYADARPWLLAIASNLLRRHWRTERRHLETWARAAAHARPTDALPERVTAELVAAPAADR